MACCCDGKKGEREAVLYDEAVVGIFLKASMWELFTTRRRL